VEPRREPKGQPVPFTEHATRACQPPRADRNPELVGVHPGAHAQASLILLVAAPSSTDGGRARVTKRPVLKRSPLEALLRPYELQLK